MEITSPLVFLLIVGVFSSTEGASCSVRTNSPNARATHTVLGTNPYPTYSCTPCDKQDYEVHAINIHKAYGPPSYFEKPPTLTAAVPITLKAAKPTNIKLVLTSYEATHWRITKSWQTTILDIAVGSEFVQYCNVTGYWGAAIPFTTYRSSISAWNSLQDTFVSVAESKFGFLTSYTGVYRTSAWLLNVGSCTPDEDITTMTPPISSVTPPFRKRTYDPAAATCVKSINDPSASATETTLTSNSYDTESCVPCVKTNHEVHVLGIYEPYETWRGFRQEPKNIVTVPVTIRADGPVDIDLVLTSYEAVHWLIGKPSYVTIIELGLASNYIDQTTVEIDGTQSLPIVKRFRDYLDFDEIDRFVDTNFAFLSSFTRVYETSAWTLTVGECINPFATTPRRRDISVRTTKDFRTYPALRTTQMRGMDRSDATTEVVTTDVNPEDLEPSDNQPKLIIPAVIGGVVAGVVVVVIIVLVITFICLRRKLGISTKKTTDQETAPRPATPPYVLPDVTGHVYEEISDPHTTPGTPHEGQYEKLRKDVQPIYNKWLMDNDIDILTKEKLTKHGVMHLDDVKKLSHSDMIEIGLNVQAIYNKWLMDNDIDILTKEKFTKHGVMHLDDVKKLSHSDMIEIGLNVGERNRLTHALSTIPKK